MIPGSERLADTKVFPAVVTPHARHIRGFDEKQGIAVMLPNAQGSGRLGDCSILVL